MDKVTVTPEDREAAATVYARLNGSVETLHANIINGSEDDYWLVDAFARHRIDSISRLSPGEGVGARELLASAYERAKLPKLADALRIGHNSLYDPIALDAIEAALALPHPEQVRMKEALEACRDKFREYERIHQAKVPDINSPAAIEAVIEKVLRNREMADMCDAALKES